MIFESSSKISYFIKMKNESHNMIVLSLSSIRFNAIKGAKWGIFRFMGKIKNVSSN